VTIENKFASVPKERLMKVTYVEGDLARSSECLGLLLTRHISLVFHIPASGTFQDTILGTTKMNALPLMWL
jgi:hypothetical protein